jgi:hypothetical protein
MSIIHMDGFDSYAALADFGMEYGVNNGQLSATAGRFGGNAYGITSYSQYLIKTLPSPLNELWIGCAMQLTGGRLGSLFVFNSANGIEAELAWGSDVNTLVVYRGDLGNPIGTYAFSPSPTSWHWVEVHYKLSSSAGVFEVWLDGVRVINVTGVSTSGAGGSTVTNIWLGSTHAGNGPSMWYDDLYIADPNTPPGAYPLGDSRIETLKPNADAGPNNGTPSSGTSHFAMVNENQWSSANSLTLDNTSGQEELFGIGSLATNPESIWAVRVLNIAEKTDAGPCSAESVVVSNGVEADGPSTPLLTTYEHVTGIFQVDPNTGAAWTYPAVNAAKCGFKVA